MTRIAIIGSGPSGFYAAQEFFKKEPDGYIDMFERLPTPFGLLRGGVAPDHQQMKTLSKLYDRIASHPNFRFFGHVHVGKDVSIDTIRRHYHAVILAVGAETDRRLGIPGDDCVGSHTATEFVGWYNGHPDYQSRVFNLNASVAVVIGQGNVAVDVVRILAKPVDDLAKTDITDTAISALRQSRITDIYMIGRRGPAQAAFTELELTELGKLAGVTVVVHDDLVLSDADSMEMAASSKVRKNITQLEMFKASSSIKTPQKTIHLMFYSSPTRIHTDANGHITGIQCTKTALMGEAGSQKAILTSETYDIPCGIVFRSIGYRGVPLDGVPFNEATHTIPHKNGHVCDQNGQLFGNVFVTGWIKRGPSGVIGTNRSDSIETVTTCLAALPTLPDPHPLDTPSLLANHRYVSYADWQKLDAYEQSEGIKKGKVRDKVTSAKEAFAVLDNHSHS